MFSANPVPALTSRHAIIRLNDLKYLFISFLL
jgi:hypothetical protein